MAQNAENPQEQYYNPPQQGNPQEYNYETETHNQLPNYPNGQPQTTRYHNSKYHLQRRNDKYTEQPYSQETVMGCTRGPLDYYENPGKNGFGGRYFRKFKKPMDRKFYQSIDVKNQDNNQMYQTNFCMNSFNAPRAMSYGKMGLLNCSKTHDNFFGKEGKRHITKGGLPLMSTYQAYFSTKEPTKKIMFRPTTGDGKTIIYKNFGGIGAKNENYFYEERLIDRDPFNENNFPPEVSRRFNPRYFPRVPFNFIPKKYKWSVLGAYTPKNGKSFHKAQIFNNYKPFLVNEFGDYGEPMD